MATAERNSVSASAVSSVLSWDRRRILLCIRPVTGFVPRRGSGSSQHLHKCPGASSCGPRPWSIPGAERPALSGDWDGLGRTGAGRSVCSAPAGTCCQAAVKQWRKNRAASVFQRAVPVSCSAQGLRSLGDTVRCKKWAKPRVSILHRGEHLLTADIHRQNASPCENGLTLPLPAAFYTAERLTLQQGRRLHYLCFHGAFSLPNNVCCPKSPIIT